VGMLIGSKGSFGPMWGIFRPRVNNRTTKLLALMIIPTVGVQAVVTGTDEDRVSKMDDINWYSPE